MKPQLRGRFEAPGRPPAFPSVLDRTYNQKSEMMHMTEQKAQNEPVPKLQLTQPLQFQKTSHKNQYSTGRAGIGTNINSTAVSVDNTATEGSKTWQMASLDQNRGMGIKVCGTPPMNQKKKVGAEELTIESPNRTNATSDIMFASE